MQGSFPVAACVVFRNGKPSKKEYRHFNIKTVTGRMISPVWRKWCIGATNECWTKGTNFHNLSSSMGARGNYHLLEEFGNVRAQGDHSHHRYREALEEIYFPEDPIPLYLDKKSESLKIVQQLRNEAHRFGITFHRNKRSKAAINGQLEAIEGIGEKTAEQLLKRFKSVKRIKAASIEALSEVIGASKAKKIYERLR